MPLQPTHPVAARMSLVYIASSPHPASLRSDGRSLICVRLSLSPPGRCCKCWEQNETVPQPGWRDPPFRGKVKRCAAASKSCGIHTRQGVVALVYAVCGIIRGMRAMLTFLNFRFVSGQRIASPIPETLHYKLWFSTTSVRGSLLTSGAERAQELLSPRAGGADTHSSEERRQGCRWRGERV